MDKCTALMSHLDNLKKFCDVGTWNSHGNDIGVVCTIRFKYKEAILNDSTSDGDSDQNNKPEMHIAYKKKTPYQMNRDHEKLQKLRKRSKNNKVMELHRCEVVEVENYFLRDPSICLSPEPVMPTVLLENSTPLRMAEECKAISLCLSPESVMPTVSECYTPLRMAEEYQAICSIHEHDLESESLSVSTPEVSTPTILKTPSVRCEPNLYTGNASFLAPVSDECSVDKLDTFSLPESTDSSSSSNELICCLCNATPPSRTTLQTCDTCDNLLCGHCALTQPFPHDFKCESSKVALNAIEEPPAIHTDIEKPPDPAPPDEMASNSELTTPVYGPVDNPYMRLLIRQNELVNELCRRFYPDLVLNPPNS